MGWLAFGTQELGNRFVKHLGVFAIGRVRYIVGDERLGFFIVWFA